MIASKFRKRFNGPLPTRGAGSFPLKKQPDDSTGPALRASLLAEWNFDDDANDSSGNGKNLTITNPPAVYAAGKVGTKCFVGDGSVTSPWGSTTAALITTGSWWFSFWLKFTSAGNWGIAGQSDSDLLASGTLLISTLIGSNKRPALAVINTGSVATVAAVASDQNDGNWHLYNCWYDASGTPSVNMNVDNGTTVSTPMVGTVRYDATVFRVGHVLGVPGIHEDLNLPGSLDAIHVFNRIPAVGEINYLYNSGNGRQLN